MNGASAVRTMRAAALAGPGQVRVSEVARPEPGPGSQVGERPDVGTLADRGAQAVRPDDGGGRLGRPRAGEDSA